MINKKRVELYLQRRARLQDTHEDAISSDFDMDDCDFKLDGTESHFDYKASDVAVVPDSTVTKKHDKDEDIPLEDLVIPELPEISMSNINQEAFNAWEQKKAKENELNSKCKETLRAEVAQSKGLSTPERSYPVLPNPTAKLISSSSGTSDAFLGRSITSVSELSIEEVQVIVKLSTIFKKMMKANVPVPPFLQDKIVSLFFAEPSTRTRCSFQAAAYRLGAKVIVVDNEASCSTAKGETLYDSVRVMGSYSDAVVIRSNETGSIARIRDQLNFPILSGGDGKGEHPTQALLDVVTMCEHHPNLFDPSREDIISIGMIGDLKNGRTVHSLAKLLVRAHKIQLTLIAPPSLQISEELLAKLQRDAELPIRQIPSLDPTCGRCDYLYVTRLQKERMTPEELGTGKYDFCIDMKTLVNIQAKPAMKIMHPLPRVNEISTEIDGTQHQLYFEQAENGMYTRMAILALVISEERHRLQGLLSML